MVWADIIKNRASATLDEMLTERFVGQATTRAALNIAEVHQQPHRLPSSSLPSPLPSLSSPFAAPIEKAAIRCSAHQRP